ncbi:hypothetical protein JOC70_002257 [Clostridium pascui]|uniref:hypothetical protein n=1 Tax=Clostridium pascui TaxID=46609 RepID=UPI00195E1280|nr:hypothetical protein [Clostridium pascui]MBM7870763.1 hypothetical protein [Clostridium pascui]
MNDFKEKLGLVIDTSIGIIMLVGSVMSILFIALDIKKASVNVYLYVFLPVILFELYYKRYRYVMNFSITREEYFQIGQILNLIFSVIIWIIYLLVAFMLNANIEVLTKLSVLFKIIFFASLSNIVSLLMVNSRLVTFLAYGCAFATPYISKYIYIDISSVYKNTAFILFPIIFGIFGKYIIRSIDFKL